MEIIRYVSKRVLETIWGDKKHIVNILHLSFNKPTEMLNGIMAYIPIKIIIPDKEQS